ncbi:MAG: ACR3 family arsenite efflux transporter [Candidatus Fermentithermobacillus carboniphilus]|uniref:ACR3 family arsenite efflux transporter n=1 Tax=Candidatus Fermentithermobacillus carboniphilus TaxID=3085328 RepID=A0AAT9LDA4_9FIRM|nr:MAG: ACR3 family arsenite efflux transporter [Candidatus Fermentithermobacillus carboniphilus]
MARHIVRTQDAQGLGFFERYLTVWVIICMVLGTLIGLYFPGFPRALSKWEYAHVSIPVAILIWFMIYPMMVQIDFGSIVRASRQPKGLIITVVVNWIIKPFTMLVLAWLFLRYLFANWIPPDLAQQYVAGAVLLGAAPCTAMVFVWSYLSGGNPAHTLVQVAINDLIILFLYAPIVVFELRLASLKVPYDTIFLSVVLYVVIPLTAGYLTRVRLIRMRGSQWFKERFLPRLKPFTIVGLLLTLIILFSFQGETIIRNPLHIVLIAVPLTIQTYLIFAIGYAWARWWRVDKTVAPPAAMIGASNFFELAVAVAISLFGLGSGAALATVVGVLEEVPIMLSLVAFANRTKHWFPDPAVSPAQKSAE